MKVEIKISSDISEPYAVIYSNQMTDEIQHIASAMDLGEHIITAKDNGRIAILLPKDIYMVRVENNKTVIYCQTHNCVSDKRLYEMEDMLGVGFMRISKSSIINMKAIAYVEPTFSGMMLLFLKNGCKDYISRKYLPAFKKYLDL